MVKPELLFKYGFLNDEGKEKFGDLSPKEREDLLSGNDEKRDFKKEIKDTVEKSPKDFVDEEKRELHAGNPPSPTGYPNSFYSMRLVYENQTLSLEEFYYWILTHLTVDLGYRRDEVYKITDIFSASEMSSFWGTTAQRLSIQQDRLRQTLGDIAGMVKTLFQLVRDLNVVDEKLDYYKDSMSKDADKASSAEKALKTQFVDLVEGGAKNPSSVFGLANQVGFTTLPHLFFQTKIEGKTREELLNNIKDKVQNMRYGNKETKNKLEDKLYQFYKWKFKTYDQLHTYRKMYKSYMKQHYTTIKLYMQWVKPYLKHARALSPDQKKKATPDLVTAFEGVLTEIEILGKKSAEKSGEYFPVIIANFDYRSQPHYEYTMNHERRAVMLGRVEMNLKAYGWTQNQINNYTQMKSEEDLELMGEVDKNLKNSMESLKSDIEAYINEKEGDEEEDNKEEEEEKEWKLVKGKFKMKPKKKQTSSLTAESVFDPFIQIFKGFKIFVEPFNLGINFQKKKPGGSSEKAADKALSGAWLLYKNYKKAHGLLTW